MTTILLFLTRQPSLARRAFIHACLPWCNDYVRLPCRQPARVRFHFLKASRVVHPDRNNTAGDEQKYIATAVFNALEQAYRVFESAELRA